MENFATPACRFHRENAVTHLCFEKQVSLVCQACIKSSQHCCKHIEQVMDIQTFIDSIEETASYFASSEEKAFKVHN